jgi:glutathione synthase
VIRQTFNELSQFASVDATTSVLRISCSPELHPGGLVEISTVYFRSGYTPDDYLTPMHFTTRFLLERSKAIKCPTIALQLAGGKKVQQVLTQPGVLERFLSDKKYGEHVFGEHEINELRASFMSMWGLDVGEDMLTTDYTAIKSGREGFGVRKARECAMSLVLKPQREGGGNNVYKEAIPEFLDALGSQERQAWIAMELIKPPEDAGNYLIRARIAESESQTATKTDVVSELGIYGWALFGGPSKSVEEKQVGWLVRTKGKENNEGGVATGFSVLDSLLLVD